jgi:hypothetical protein
MADMAMRFRSGGGVSWSSHGEAHTPTWIRAVRHSAFEAADDGLAA